jgi:hypothetical protein
MLPTARLTKKPQARRWADGGSPDSGGKEEAGGPAVTDEGAPDSAGNEDAGTPASPVRGSASLDEISQIAAQSQIARYAWKDRGVA